MGLASNYNRRMILDGVCKQTRESRHRILRRWEHFCNGIGLDPSLNKLSTRNANIVIKSFLEFHLNSEFHVDGRICGQRSRTMVVVYARNTTSQLCAAMQNAYKRDPIHNTNGKGNIPVVTEFIKLLEKTSPPEKKQRVITPKFLRKLASLGTDKEIRNKKLDHIADLII